MSCCAWLIDRRNGAVVAEEQIDGEECAAESPNTIRRGCLGESFEGRGEEIEGEEWDEGWTTGLIVDVPRPEEGEAGERSRDAQ